MPLSGNLSFLFIIPARGDSKRVPRKNLRSLCGQPLLGYVIDTARKVCDSRDFNRTRLLVSTEDDEIARVARTYGAEVPFMRPSSLARDDSTTMDVILHALDELKARESFNPDVVVLLQPTSPLVSVDDIGAAIALHLESRSPVVGIVANSHPLQWQYYLEAGQLRPVFDDIAASRRQGMRDTYRLNGAVYIASADHLKVENTFVTKASQGYVMPVERSIDIDTEIDFLIAETLLNRRCVGAIPGDDQ